LRRGVYETCHSPAAWIAVVGTAYLVVNTVAFKRVHIDRPITMAWCAALALAISARQPSSRVVTLLVDWIPLFLVLTAFDYARGAGSRLGVGVSYLLSPQLDHALTGTIPTVWLQRHLYGASTHHWWNVFPTLTYFSFYFVTWLILAVLWGRSRARFRVYSRRFLAVTLASLVVFSLHPTAPPWMDSRRHVIPHITRTTVFGLQELHLSFAQHSFYSGAALANQVAAFPSLHAAYSTLPLLLFWRQARPLVRMVLLLYPLAMGFSLILMGEHWLGDVLAAWLLTAVIAFGMPVVERRLGQLHTRRSEPDARPQAARPPAVVSVVDPVDVARAPARRVTS
jgi:membrane-associated phospholipid phosphatase